MGSCLATEQFLSDARICVEARAEYLADCLCFSFAANLVLQDTIERIFVADVYADIPRGIYLVRGENVLMLGEIVRFYHPCLSLAYTGRAPN